MEHSLAAKGKKLRGKNIRQMRNSGKEPPEVRRSNWILDTREREVTLCFRRCTQRSDVKFGELIKNSRVSSKDGRYFLTKCSCFHFQVWCFSRTFHILFKILSLLWGEYPGVSCSIVRWFVNVIIFMSVSYTEHVDSQHYCNNGWLWVCSYEKRLIYFSVFQDGLFLFIVSKDIFRTTQKCSLSLSPPFSSPLHPLKLKVVLAMFDLAYLWAGFPQERKERLVQHTNTMGCQGLMEAGIQCGVQCVLYLCISRCFEPRVSHLYARHV